MGGEAGGRAGGRGRKGGASVQEDNEHGGLYFFAQTELIFTGPAAVYLESDGVGEGRKASLRVRVRIRNEYVSPVNDLRYQRREEYSPRRTPSLL